MRQKLYLKKTGLRAKRKTRVRGKIFGEANKPRISIFKSNKYFYAQAIDDREGITLVAVDGAKSKLGNNKEDVKKLATEMADKLKDKKVEDVVFDRNGYLYHGVVASFADALREAGIRL